MRTARLALRSKTEIWLHLHAWATADALIGDGPSLRANMMYGSCDTRGFEMRLARLEKRLILERQPGGKKDRIYRLTARGRMIALGGRDPEACWNRKWNGLWSVILFDLPKDQAKERASLLRFLRARGLGCLQGSVWLSPHPFSELDAEDDGMVHPQSLLVLRGRPEGEVTDRQLVEAAWNWEEIEKAWRAHERLLADAPAKSADRMQRIAWSEEEFHAWKHLMTIDPLLPKELWLPGYRGRKVFVARCEKLPGCVAGLVDNTSP